MNTPNPIDTSSFKANFHSYFVLLLLVMSIGVVHAQAPRKPTNWMLAPINTDSLVLYVTGSVVFSKQSLKERGVTTPFNYLYDEVNNNVYKTGFSLGVRFEGKLKRNNRYSVSVTMNQINAGTYYKKKFTLSPFIEEFTHFKSDKIFTTINIAPHYKYFIPLRGIKNYTFYAIAGPSFDYRISKISQESLVNRATKRAFIGADFGTEIERDSRYLFFAHYKLSTNISQTTVPVKLNRFETGMCINTKHLFNSKIK
jgi:hypothetical protein